MAIETRPRPTGGPDLVLTACPICGYEFRDKEQRHRHFAAEHTPADIGL